MISETWTIGNGVHRVYFVGGNIKILKEGEVGLVTREEAAREILDAMIDDKVIDPMTVTVAEMVDSEENEVCELSEKEIAQMVIENIKRVWGIK